MNKMFYVIDPTDNLDSSSKKFKEFFKSNYSYNIGKISEQF